MKITHNICAENAQRQYKITETEKMKAAEKLSSGYRINRSADDAAGLSISEKMRRLIRGLDQGSNNIQDGISLCQVADGALAEVTSVLQRVRELSIQAYNGTNSKSDRACIQDEIDNCLLEVDEIKERTKFNEIYLLKGNEHTDGLVKVPEIYQKTDIKIESRVIPDWLIINDGKDKKIEEHADYNFTASTDEIMFADYSYKDDNGVKRSVSIYYGEPKGETLQVYGKQYTYIEDFVQKNSGKDFYPKLLDQNTQLADYIAKHFDKNQKYDGWTTDNTDNVSCKLDFGGLIANTTDTDSLYTNMFNLMGCEIGFPCGTCSKVNAICFSGSEAGWSVREFQTMGSYQSIGYLSLSENPFTWSLYAEDGSQTDSSYTYHGYFDAITSLYAIKNETVRTEKAKELAEVIASDLADRMKTLLSDGMDGHFDRAAGDNDPAKNNVLYVYDYRDTDALLNPTDSDSRVITTTSTIQSEYTYDAVRYHYADAEKNRTFGLKIHCSANSYDSIPLLLREISRDSLNLRDYSVNHYTVEVTYLHDLYAKELATWQDKMNSLEYKTYQETRPYTQVKKLPVYESWFDNGELHHVLKEAGEFETVQKTVTLRRPVGAAPQRPHLKSTAEEIYTPSSLDLIDKALETVSALRSYFGV